MEDCIQINEKLVKTLFLCNRQQSSFYLYITSSEKPFSSKDFSKALGISRLSFATEELMKEKLGVKIGAATIFGLLLDRNQKIQVVIDQEVLSNPWFGCSDGTTTGYMKLKSERFIDQLLESTDHKAIILG